MRLSFRLYFFMLVISKHRSCQTVLMNFVRKFWYIPYTYGFDLYFFKKVLLFYRRKENCKPVLIRSLKLLTSNSGLIWNTIILLTINTDFNTMYYDLKLCDSFILMIILFLAAVDLRQLIRFISGFIILRYIFTE